MTKARFWMLSGTALAALTGVSTPVLAQSGPADAGDIVVTARRVEERLQDVPISITVFSQDQLTQRNVSSANDLAVYTPSLTSNARYGSDNATFAIRGFVQQGLTSPSVAVYFADVVSLRVQAPTGAAGNGAGPGAFFDLQNVQVLKGPQGTLFGRNTTGGAILLVPQRPTDKLEGYVEGSIGNYDMRRIQAVVNVPLGDTLRFRAGIEHQKRDGFVRNRSGIGPDDFSDIDYVAGRASLLWDITPDLENYTVASISKSDTNGLVPRVVATATGPNCSPAVAGAGALLGPLICSQQQARAAQRGDGLFDVENSVPDPFLTIKQWQVINTTTWTASDAITLKNIASYGEYRQDFTGNSFGDNIVLPATFGPLAGRPFGYVTNYRNGKRHFASQRSFTEELQLQGRAGESFNYQMGAYYERALPLDGYQGSLAPILLSCTDTGALQCIDPIRAGFLQASLSKYKFTNIGLYAQGTYKLTDQFSVTGGFRYTIDKTVAQAASQTIRFPTPITPSASCIGNGGIATPDVAAPTAACEVAGVQKSKRPTWLIDVDYKPVEDVLLYAKYARGYRQGGVDAGNSIVIAWGPEKVDSYEIGAKASFRGAVSGNFNIAAFYNDFTNQQLAASLVPDGTVAGRAPAQAIVNAGTSRIQGIEVDAGLNSFDGMRLSADYAYLDTLLKSYTAPIFPGYVTPEPSSRVGGDLILAPKHKLTLSANYTLPLDQSVGEITFGATYTYTARQLASAATDPRFQYLPSTDLVNLNFNWNNVAGSPIDLSVFATNVTNEKYPNFIGAGYVSQGSETFILAEPRMYGARVRVRFGS